MTLDDMMQYDIRHAQYLFKRQYVVNALKESNGNVVRATKKLGYERSALYRYMRDAGITIQRDTRQRPLAILTRNPGGTFSPVVEFKYHGV